MTLRLAGAFATVVSGLDSAGWLREVSPNDALPGLKVNQQGTGRIVDFQDGGASMLYIPDGGDVYIVNKLVAPTVGPASGQQHALPATASDTVALLAAAQALTNKTLGAGTLFGANPNFQNNQVLGFRPENLTADPGVVAANEGRVIYRSDAGQKKLRLQTDTAWIDVAGGGVSLSDSAPLAMNGTTGAAGTGGTASRTDHRHALGPLVANLDAQGNRLLNALLEVQDVDATPVGDVLLRVVDQVLEVRNPGATAFVNVSLGRLTAGTDVVTPTVGPTASQQHALPAVASDTVVLVGATQTLTGKTLTGPVIQGTVGAGTGLTMPAFTIGGNLTGSVDIKPAADNAGNLGVSGTRWSNVWATIVNAGDVAFQNGWKLTELEKLGLDQGMALVRPDGSVARVWT